MTAPAEPLDSRPGLGPTIARVVMPFGGTILWALHLAAIFAAAGLLCRNGTADDSLLGTDRTTVWVVGLTILAAVPTAVLALLGRRLDRPRHEGDPAERGVRFEARPGLRPFAAAFTTWLNIVMLYAILLEGSVVLFVRPCG